MPQSAANEARKLSPNAKLAVDFGPLIVFLIGNAKLGIRWGTAAFVIAMIVAMAYSWSVERKLSPMAIVTLGFVVVFGGLTVWLDDELFIKIKLTVIEALIGVALLAGLAFGKLFIKSLLGMAVPMDDDGWRKFTVRFALFSFGLAALNEVARVQLTTDHWVWFKVGGVPVLTVLFMLTQMPLFKRHALPESQDPDAA